MFELAYSPHVSYSKPAGVPYFGGRPVESDTIQST